MLPVRYLCAGQRPLFAGTGRPCRNRLPAGAGNACPGVPEGENCNLRACRKTQGETQAKAEGKKQRQRAGRRRMGRAFASCLALFCIKVRETPGRRSRRPFFRKGMEQRRGKGQRIFRISACKTHGRAKRAPSRAWCCAGARGGAGQSRERPCSGKNMLPVRYLCAGQRPLFAGTGRPCRNRLPAGAGNACPGVPEGENCNLRACRKTQGETQAKAEGKKQRQRAGRRRMGRAFASCLALFCIKVRETPGRRSRRPP